MSARNVNSKRAISLYRNFVRLTRAWGPNVQPPRIEEAENKVRNLNTHIMGRVREQFKQNKDLQGKDLKRALAHGKRELMALTVLLQGQYRQKYGVPGQDRMRQTTEAEQRRQEGLSGTASAMEKSKYLWQKVMYSPLWKTRS